MPCWSWTTGRATARPTTSARAIRGPRDRAGAQHRLRRRRQRSAARARHGGGRAREHGRAPRARLDRARLCRARARTAGGVGGHEDARPRRPVARLRRGRRAPPRRRVRAARALRARRRPLRPPRRGLRRVRRRGALPAGGRRSRSVASTSASSSTSRTPTSRCGCGWRAGPACTSRPWPCTPARAQRAARAPVHAWAERNTLLLVARAFPGAGHRSWPTARRRGHGTRCAGRLGAHLRGAGSAVPLLPEMWRERRELRSRGGAGGGGRAGASAARVRLGARDRAAVLTWGPAGPQGRTAPSSSARIASRKRSVE